MFAIFPQCTADVRTKRFTFIFHEQRFGTTAGSAFTVNNACSGIPNIFSKVIFVQ